MPSLKSADIRKALMKKMLAVEEKDHRDRFYTIADNAGRIVGVTSISQGSNEPLSAHRVSRMSGRGQLNLDDAGQLVDIIKCPLSREDALKIMQRNWPPGSSRLKQ